MTPIQFPRFPVGADGSRQVATQAQGHQTSSNGGVPNAPPHHQTASQQQQHRQTTPPRGAENTPQGQSGQDQQQTSSTAAEISALLQSAHALQAVSFFQQTLESNKRISQLQDIVVRHQVRKDELYDAVVSSYEGLNRDVAALKRELEALRTGMEARTVELDAACRKHDLIRKEKDNALEEMIVKLRQKEELQSTLNEELREKDRRLHRAKEQLRKLNDDLRRTNETLQEVEQRSAETVEEFEILRSELEAAKSELSQERQHKRPRALFNNPGTAAGPLYGHQPTLHALTPDLSPPNREIGGTHAECLALLGTDFTQGPFGKLDDLPAEVRLLVNDILDRSGDTWKNMIRSNACVARRHQNKVSVWSLTDGSSAACQSCVNSQKICLRVRSPGSSEATIVALPLPQSLRLGIDSSQKAYWLFQGSGSSPPRIWK